MLPVRWGSPQLLQTAGELVAELATRPRCVRPKEQCLRPCWRWPSRPLIEVAVTVEEGRLRAQAGSANTRTPNPSPPQLSPKTSRPPKSETQLSPQTPTTTSLASIDHSWSPHPPAGGPCTSICLYPTPFARAETPLAIPNSISHSDPPSNFGTQNSTFEFDREKLTKVCRTVLLPLPRDLAFCIAVLGE